MYQMEQIRLREDNTDNSEILGNKSSIIFTSLSVKQNSIQNGLKTQGATKTSLCLTPNLQITTEYIILSN